MPATGALINSPAAVGSDLVVIEPLANICSLSMPSLETANRGTVLFARVLAWSLAAAIVVLSVVPPTLRPETALPHCAEHFGIFCATGIAFGLAHNRRHLLLLVLLAMFAGGVEILQLMAPGRHARLSDFVVDAVAACVGAVMPLLARRMSLKLK